MQCLGRFTLAAFLTSLTSLASPSSWQKLDLLALSLTTVTSRRGAPCAENDIINVLDEPYFGTHILSNSLPFQTFEIPKKNTQPLISIRGLAFNVLLRSSEK